MGAGASSTSAGSIEEATAELLDNCKYYVDDKSTISHEEVALAKESWRLIIDNESPEYIRMKLDPSFEPTSCLSWFYDSFFILSSEQDGSSAALYEGKLKVQIRALTGMMSASLKLFAGATDQVDVILHRIAHGHYKKGVRVFQYPIVGAVLFDTFALCLGDAWDDATRRAWHRIFSHMLRVLIPVGMADEREGEKHGLTTKIASETVSEPPRHSIEKTVHKNNDSVASKSASDQINAQPSSSTTTTASSNAPTTSDTYSVQLSEIASGT